MNWPAPFCRDVRGSFLETGSNATVITELPESQVGASVGVIDRKQMQDLKQWTNLKTP